VSKRSKKGALGWASRNLKRDLDRYEKRSDNHPVYEFESMSICGFAILFEVYYKKTPNIYDGYNNDSRG
jgi:hypothetical protein